MNPYVNLLISEIIEKYQEWLEMSDEPHYLLIDILGSLLLQAREENKYLKKIDYTNSNLGENTL